MKILQITNEILFVILFIILTSEIKCYKNIQSLMIRLLFSNELVALIRRYPVSNAQ
ncbi:MAG: hypothetical protein OFPII_30310 [Osedax symbiont Rs1]|nr:MAG: hypothetical protein OFPII_30310 [Osedax symbiont Rs1]